MGSFMVVQKNKQSNLVLNREGQRMKTYPIQIIKMLTHITVKFEKVNEPNSILTSNNKTIVDFGEKSDRGPQYKCIHKDVKPKSAHNKAGKWRKGPFLAGGVPNLGLDDLVVDMNTPGGELDANGGFGFEAELVLGETRQEVGFPLLNMPNLDYK